ncbi:ent-copalyl diphosphate synthase, chloroplastic-like [Medicago truncatula]|uniref:ent-copalyl diphosphate synthase, chloroplastic-like n=1 Tax=Medicago truncatula TaxID=3880 RepID=UPI0019673C66|nr:ent-copalyl diphosphate synthase, chloroplastic-like [Medicago truncatula]
MWVVDRLERLGILRYFQQEIRESMNYVSRYWTKKGICWARNSEVQDINDTAMGFRILRLHWPPSFTRDSQVLFQEEKILDDGMFNLYRDSQVLFQEEKILDDAKNFSAKYLTKKHAANELLDKWIITNDLPGKVSSNFILTDFKVYGSIFPHNS